jgi:predicted metal-dependent phosphoesterase TrpH
MQPTSRITTNWREPGAIATYSTGVSLHSHTSLSEETLNFIHALGVALPGGMAVARHYERLCLERHGLRLDFNRANWRPPLQPKMAYELEAEQIRRLGLYPLVSITDHDTIDAALLLRTVSTSRHIPMSVEWSAPFGQTVFHLGVHNLPSADGAEWMRRFVAYTVKPEDGQLLRILRELDAEPQVLVVLNHPLWDLYKVGQVHGADLRRFIREAGRMVHAIELNGLRHARENREAARLARDTGHLMISGGDRHGLEPNANINLTMARNFTEFVEEIRLDRVSHLHFMDQYQERWEQRILRSTLNAVTDFPEFVPGWQMWDERCFHPDQTGEMKPLSELWPAGRPPLALMTAIRIARLMRKPGVSAPLSWAFHGVNDFQHGLEWC